MLKPGQIKWYDGRRYRIARVPKSIVMKRGVCEWCKSSNGGISPPCKHLECLRTMPADCYPKPDPRTPKRL